jgi:hypothetical protein
MLKIDETIRASVRSYISSKLMFAFIREILQLLITRYKKIDDQIKKQIHEKFQALKQSSFRNHIEIWITNWENLRSRILSLSIKNFFDSETMFVEKFLTTDRKWAFMFCDNWILQKCATLRNVHFEETIREYKNAAKKSLKIVEHANVATLQNQSQSQSKKSTSSICSSGDILTFIWLAWHHASVTLTPANQIRKELSKDFAVILACCTHNKLEILQQENFVELLSWSSAFDTCKHDPNRALFDVGYQAWNESFLQLFQELNFWCSASGH